MAYTSVQSGEIPEGTQYYSGKLPLGDYNFYLNFDATGVLPKIVTKCESPDGEIRTAAAGTLRGNVQIRGWSVEANETEASVYVIVKKKKEEPLVVGDLNSVVLSGEVVTGTSYRGVDVRLYPLQSTYFTIVGSTLIGGVSVDQEVHSLFWFSEAGGVAPLATAYKHNGKTVYYATIDAYYYGENSMSGGVIPTSEVTPADARFVAWTMVYAGDEEEGNAKTELIARFAIDLGEAGGYPGGGGGWISPGDWNIDPTTTLHLTVNGALSGRHNDPLNDPSYSYIPAENTAQAGYGCGGDGGHGGGGGGGASTVITEQFATNKANSKVIVVTVKRHGYGSGGSKGAKGGNGCILIYY